MKYMILSAGFPDELEEGVNGFIREGWTLLGGVSVSLAQKDYADPDSDIYIFAQALIKEAE